MALAVHIRPAPVKLSRRRFCNVGLCVFMRTLYLSTNVSLRFRIMPCTLCMAISIALPSELFVKSMFRGYTQPAGRVEIPHESEHNEDRIRCEEISMLRSFWASTSANDIPRWSLELSLEQTTLPLHTVARCWRYSYRVLKEQCWKKHLPYFYHFSSLHSANFFRQNKKRIVKCHLWLFLFYYFHFLLFLGTDGLRFWVSPPEGVNPHPADRFREPGATQYQISQPGNAAMILRILEDSSTS